jgi:hypothetical protein
MKTFGELRKEAWENHGLLLGPCIYVLFEDEMHIRKFEIGHVGWIDINDYSLDIDEIPDDGEGGMSPIFHTSEDSLSVKYVSSKFPYYIATNEEILKQYLKK